LLAEPHYERRAADQREYDHQPESPPGVLHDLYAYRIMQVLEPEASEERLYSAYYERAVARILSYHPAPVLAALFREFFEIREREREQMHDDRTRYIRHDAEREDRHLRHSGARKEVHYVEQRTARPLGFLLDELGKSMPVDARRRYIPSEAIYGKKRRRHEQLLLELGYL